MSAAFRIAGVFLAAFSFAGAAEPVVTVISDFEQDDVAVAVGDTRNIAPGDCVVAATRGLAHNSQRRLEVALGATQRDASVVCDLHFRLPTRFSALRSIAVWIWLPQGQARVAFRVQDDAGRLFETTPLIHDAFPGWRKLMAPAAEGDLRPVDSPGGAEPAPPAAPFVLVGVRVAAAERGRLEVLLDNLEVEHEAEPHETLRTEFLFDQPTRLYQPGSLARSKLRLENLSRARQLRLNVELRWLRSDGSELAAERKSIVLPPATERFRSQQEIDFSQPLAEPDLYRLVASLRADGWRQAVQAETSIACVPNNRSLSRGRATFFGVRSNMMGEPLIDQRLEIQAARELGAQLLAIDAPWRRLEPRSGTYDLARLSAIVAELAERDIVPLIVLTSPPAWVGQDAPVEAQFALVERLAQELGDRAPYYQLMPSKPSLSPEALAEFTERLRATRPAVTVLPPAGAAGAQVEPGGMLRTEGSVEQAIAAARSAAQASSGIAWWRHASAPLEGPGRQQDAVDFLRLVLRAAELGVEHVIWADLRDDTTDERRPEQMRGLLRRDFSPRATAMGFATSVGMLAGRAFAGPLRAAPDSYETALFISGDRQVAVMLPKPNRVRAAMLAPVAMFAGDLSMYDLARQQLPLPASGGPTLCPALSKPFFLVLATEKAQNEPGLLFGNPWIDAPGIVFCRPQGDFELKITLPRAVRSGYVRLDPPEGAPVQSSFGARSVRGEAGQELSFPITLNWRGEETVAEYTLPLTVRLERETYEVPIVAAPTAPIRAVANSVEIVKPEHRVGVLRRLRGRPDEGLALHAAHQARKLHFAFGLPTGVDAQARLRLRVALQDSESEVEVEALDPAGEARLSPVRGVDEKDLRIWRAQAINAPESGGAFCHIEAPASAFGSSSLPQGARLIVSAVAELPGPVPGEAPREYRLGAVDQGRWMEIVTDATGSADGP